MRLVEYVALYCDKNVVLNEHDIYSCEIAASKDKRAMKEENAKV